MSKIYTVSELQKILTPIFRQNGVKQAILFGSYAKGLATTKSNIDLLVDNGLQGLAFFGLLGIEDTARDWLDRIIPEMSKAAGATEDLIARDQMAWVGLMNNCKTKAEEIIRADLIYT